MKSVEYSPVNLAYPGRRTRKAVRILKGALFAVLAFLSFTPGLPAHAATRDLDLDATRSGVGGVTRLPRGVGADPVPELKLPQPIVSGIDRLINAGGVTQTSRDNITIYNRNVRMNLLGGVLQRDQLLGPDPRVQRSWSSWTVQAQLGDRWIPLIPQSNNFTVLGTNATGTYVVRKAHVEAAPFSGTLEVVYKTTSPGPLKWDLGFVADATGLYRLVFVWSTLASSYSLSAEKKQFQARYQTVNYTFSWADIPDSFNTTVAASPGLFSLSVDLGNLTAGSRVAVDPNMVSEDASSAATAFTFQRKVFYEPEGGHYFVFYHDGNAVGYRSSKDGVAWSERKAMPEGWPSNGDLSAPTVFNSGGLVFVATGEAYSSIAYCTSSPCLGYEARSVYFSVGNVSGPNISWLPETGTGRFVRIADTLGRLCNLGAMCTVGTRSVGVTFDSAGQPAFSYNWYASNQGGEGLCAANTSSESAVVVVYRSRRFFVSCDSSHDLDARPVVLPSQTGVRVIYQHHDGAGVRLLSREIAVSNSGSIGPHYAYEDTYVSRSHLNDVYGAAQTLSLKSSSTEDDYVLLKFYPSFSNDMVVTQATLQLGVSGSGSGGAHVDVYETSSPWEETTVNFNPPPSIRLLYPSRLSDVDLNSTSEGMVLSVDVTNTLVGFNTGRLNYIVGLLVKLEPTYGAVRSLPLYSRDYPCCSGYVARLTITYDCCIRPVETIDNVFDSGEYSALLDSDYGTHVVYRTWDQKVSYAYHPPQGSSWSPPSADILSGWAQYPTITLDYSTGDLYVFAVKKWQDVPGMIAIKSKPIDQDWGDRQLATFLFGQPIKSHLGSNYVSASGTNSSRISLVWTEQTNTDFDVMYASFPISPSWSPFASPSSPWDGYGLVPNGQYFASLGEYVSPSSGMLTVQQTDLELAGRGLDLSITRVYTQPRETLGGQIYDSEDYPWAPLGNGWQLSFPWMDNVSKPLYIHLSNGQGYRIPHRFWTDSWGGVFENHQGDHFRMVRVPNGTIVLYSKSGTSYSFDLSRRLATITDVTGNNTIRFSYDSSSRISTICDTVGRLFMFNYPQGVYLLQSISQMAYAGNCSGTQPRRTVTYGHDANNNLASVTDPAGRVTGYSYNPLPLLSSWLISRITYSTGWYTEYSYEASQGAEDWNVYRVIRQCVSSGTQCGTSAPGSTVRQFEYIYTTGPGDQVTGSTVKSYNGTQPQPSGYTDYAFSWGGMTRNVSDASHTLVGGVQQLFGVQGEVVKEIVLVTDGLGGTGSYTNHYSYDHWGNLIYSRRSINPSQNGYRETYSAYYNNSLYNEVGLQLGYYSFFETFSTQSRTRADRSWQSYGTGDWRVEFGEYSLTGTGGNESRIEAPHGDSEIRVKTRWVDGPWFEAYLGFRYQDDGKHYRVYLSKSEGLLRFDKVDSGQVTLLNSVPFTLWPGLSYYIRIQSSGYYHNVTVNGVQLEAYDEDYSMRKGKYLALGTSAAAGVAGPVHINFDDITIQPLPNSFQNKFFSNTVGVSIHNRLAGIAEFQNGTGTLPVETYYSYFAWGGLAKTIQRYDPTPGTVRWLQTVWTYDEYGNVKSVTSPRGFTTEHGYDPAYKGAYATSVMNGAGWVQRFEYDFNRGHQTAFVDARGSRTDYQRHYAIYQPGNWGGTCDPPTLSFAGATMTPSWQYEGYTVTLTASACGGTQPYTFTWKAYPYGNVVGYGPSITWTLPSNAAVVDLLIVEISDAHGSVVQSQILDFVRILLQAETWTTHLPDIGGSRGVITTARDYTGRVTTVTDEQGRKTKQHYDGLGRLTRIEQFEGSLSYSNETYTYNWQDKVAKATDALGNVYRYQYDVLGRIVQVNKPDGNSTQYYYDDLYPYVRSTNEKGHVRFDLYDRVGRRTNVLEQLHNVFYIFSQSDYVYDDVGNLKTVLNTNIAYIQYTRHSYDNLNRLMRTDYQDGTFETYSYDDNGNLVRRVDRKGFETSYLYDPLDRLWLLGSTEAVEFVLAGCGYCVGVTTDYYGYDPNGNLFAVQTKNATLTYEYDARNRLLNETYVVNGNSQPYSATYSYDGDTLRTLSYPDGLTVRYSHDIQGRVAEVCKVLSTSCTKYASFTYNKADQITQVNYGNGLLAKYEYDPLRLRRLTVKDGSAVRLDLNYQYEPTGTVSSVTGQTTDTVEGATLPVGEQYSYDPLGRLTNANVITGPISSTLSYEYDPVGNRLRQTKDGVATIYTRDMANDQLKRTYTGANTYSDYSYDGNGNLKTANVTDFGTSRRTYTWSEGTDRLLKVVRDGLVYGIYDYDGLGRLVRSVEGSTSTFYAYLGTETLYEKKLAGSSTTTTDYVYATGLRIARVSGSTVNYYHTDHLGSTRLVTSSSKSVQFSNGYQPFGQDNGFADGSEKYKFTGKPVSQTTGLYYYGARWYDPEIGRFISPDPRPGRLSRPQSLNPYVYVVNSPLNYVDPWGEPECGFWDIGCHGGNVWNAGVNAWNSLGPEYQQLIILAVAVALVIPTGGTSMLLVGAAGFGVGVGAYLGYTYATGGNPTLAGALTWGNAGFAIATFAYGGYRIGARFLGSSSMRGGALPVKLGQEAVGNVVSDLKALGLKQGTDFVVDKAFPLSTGGNVRPDIVVHAWRTIIEVKGGVASGSRVTSQAIRYSQLAEDMGYDLYYVLNKGASGPFRHLLEKVLEATVIG